MRPAEIDVAIAENRLSLGLPVTDPLTRPGSELVDMVLQAFPSLERASADLSTLDPRVSGTR
jgi:hypothetical protein